MTTDHKKLKKKCDDLWSWCVRARAGFKSELSGIPGIVSKKTGKIVGLDAHHLVGKSSYYLRYNLENGICLLKKEHLYQAHHQDRVEHFRHEVVEVRGYDVFEYLYHDNREHQHEVVDLQTVYERLQAEKIRLEMLAENKEKQLWGV